MGLPKILSGFRSLSVSAKATPPTPPDSHPPTPGHQSTYRKETQLPTSAAFTPQASAKDARSKRWTRNFTSPKSIPQPISRPSDARKPSTVDVPISPTTVAVVPVHATDASPIEAVVKAVLAPAHTRQQTVIGILQKVDKEFNELFKKAHFEGVALDVRRARDITTLRKTYQWQQAASTKPPFPPCLLSIPEDEVTGILQIFNFTRLLGTAVAGIPPAFVPDNISQYIFGDVSAYNIAGLYQNMHDLRRAHKNIGTEPSIANRPDWYSDAVFAQTCFTGPNPTSIRRASTDWIHQFAEQAQKQKNESMYLQITTSDPASFYIKDYSYFRKAAGAFPGSMLQSDDGKRHGCAAVTLLQLSTTGQLHPLAIVIDWVMTMDHSVVLFNERLRSTDPTGGERDNWPWRYAKTCHMISDYYQHELAVHLNDCHFIEETVIVAASRSLTADHIVYKLLEPHWLKTLSLNASARSTLVPLINEIVGLSAVSVTNFVLDAYKSFNFQESYIPAQLAKRGFEPATLDDPIFHNYAWARNMIPMWQTLHSFVTSALKPHYKSDADVASDPSIRSWYTEMHSPTGAQMSTFPTITTISSLASAITMCIHIASPQHNSVNYLQCYYMSFVPAKPPCFLTPLPRSLQALQAYKEKDLMAALPNKDERVWLLAEQIPYLLSYGVSEDQTLVAYAEELEEEARREGDESMEGAARGLRDGLAGLGEVFERHSGEMDDRVVAYNVMDPTELAVSILI